MNALDFLVGVWGADLFVSVISHLFILGIVNSETHSGSRYYSYGQMGSLQPPSYPHQLHSQVKPRCSALARGSPPHLGWLPAPQDLLVFPSLHQMSAHQPHPSLISQGLFTSSAWQPFQAHFLLISLGPI